jgi:hypothetical protein
VRVPEEAGLGEAKATYSFPAWKQGEVAPTTSTFRVKALEDAGLRVGPDAGKKGGN